MIYHGYAPNEKVKEAVMESHIFAYPSIFEETSCLSAIEAMMAGCHVVTTNYGALPETCAEFATMIEFEPNLKALAERFASALDSVLTKYRAGGYKQTRYAYANGLLQ
jgi:UDP-glucose:(glucosyl)LPS alpha-1,2-glucosyltransferase